MLKTIVGTFKSGIVRLDESVPDMPEGPVLVTFLQSNASGSNAPSLTPEQVAELRGKLAAWEQDWNARGMEAYDEPYRGGSGPAGNAEPLMPQYATPSLGCDILIRA